MNEPVTVPALFWFILGGFVVIAFVFTYVLAHIHNLREWVKLLADANETRQDQMLDHLKFHKDSMK